MQTTEPTDKSLPRDLLMRRAPRILLAEDDTDTRMLLAEGLADDGCIVVEARDGNELLDQLANHSDGHISAFDAVVTDIMMPGYSGLDVLTAFRGRAGSTPVVVITAYGDPNTERLASSLGAAAVLRKPFDFEELRALLAELLDRGRPPSTSGRQNPGRPA